MAPNNAKMQWAVAPLRSATTPIVIQFYTWTPIKPVMFFVVFLQTILQSMIWQALPLPTQVSIP